MHLSQGVMPVVSRSQLMVCTEHPGVQKLRNQGAGRDNETQRR
jgi:hypothetical protein